MFNFPKGLCQANGMRLIAAGIVVVAWIILAFFPFIDGPQVRSIGRDCLVLLGFLSGLRLLLQIAIKGAGSRFGLSLFTTLILVFTLGYLNLLGSAQVPNDRLLQYGPSYYLIAMAVCVVWSLIGDIVQFIEDQS